MKNFLLLILFLLSCDNTDERMLTYDVRSTGDTDLSIVYNKTEQPEPHELKPFNFLRITSPEDYKIDLYFTNVMGDSITIDASNFNFEHLAINDNLIVSIRNGKIETVH